MTSYSYSYEDIVPMRPNEQSWRNGGQSETLCHFKPSNSSHAGYPQQARSNYHVTSTKLNILPTYSDHSHNISNFITKQMGRPQPLHQRPQPPPSLSSLEQSQRGFIQQADMMRAKRIQERQKMQENLPKPGPQHGFGGVCYLPAKPAGVVYRRSSEQTTWNASDVKQALLEWCRNRVAGYRNVRIDNFSSSWADGLAFCALVDHFIPDAFDFNSLSPHNRRFNFALAFSTAEQLAGIPAILDVDDMVSMQSPDWKSVFTYLQAFYGAFKNTKRF